MSTKIFQLAAFIAAVTMTSIPAVSQAATVQAQNPVKITYQTSMQSIPGPSAPWTGSLQLTINPDGIIQGWYHPADNMTALIPVNGGRNGERVWLDIGRQGSLHVSGTIRNGEITGSGIDNGTHQLFSFNAKA